MARLVVLLTVLSWSSLVAGSSVEHLSHIRVSIEDQIAPSSCQTTLDGLHTLLTGAAIQLYNKTNTAVQRVTVSLPRSWYSSPCVQGLALTRAGPQSPDIVVLNSAETDIKTVQFAGCGQRGKRILLPHQRVERRENVTRDVTDLLISLLKYEFGYFNTQPSVGDELNFPESNQTSEMLAEPERCSPDPLNDTDYNTEAPTQQNLLCQEQSPLSVIKSGLISESENSDVRSEGRSPIVEYVISQKTRHLLVLDRSQQSKHVWKHLRNALYRLISTFPEYDEVAIVTYGRYAETRLAPTVITDLNRVGIFSRLPGKLNQDTVGCLQCAISEASSLVSDSDDVETKIIIVNSSPVEDRAKLASSLESLGQQSEVSLMVTEDQWLVDQPTLSKVNVFSVNKEERTSVTDLYEILSFSLRSDQSVKFYSRQFRVESNGGVSGKFVVEDSLRDSLVVVASSLQQEDIEMFRLTSPSGLAHTFPVLDKGQAQFRLSGGAEAGVWSYEVKLTPRTLLPTVPLHLAAYAQPTDLSKTVRLEAWTHSDTARHSPVILARLTEAELPVVGAEVVAEVSLPDGETLNVVLHDSGTGYPDIQTGDGIYSAYLTELSQLAGLYSIKVSATNHQGRASVASVGSRGQCSVKLQHIPALHFSRYARTPSFFRASGETFSIIDGVPVRKDVYPPGRVTDLKVSGLSGQELEISWTAPGGDLDKGRADSYQLRWSQNRKLLMEQFETDGNILDNSDSLSPGYFGTPESVNISVPHLNTVLYLALVAKDEADNASPVSNIVKVLVEQDVSTEDSLSSQLSQVTSLTLSDVSTTAWVYILSISLASITLIIIMLLVIIIRRRRMRKLQENCPIPYFIELGPPAPGDKTDHQLISPPTRDRHEDTLSYPSPSHPSHPHPVLELYHQHARQYQMYQDSQGQPHSDSGRSSSSSDSSDKASDRGSPGWQRTGATSGTSAASGSSSSSLRQSRRRRESFV